MCGPAPESRLVEDDLKMDDDAVAAARDKAADFGRAPGVPWCLPTDVGAVGMALLGRLLTDLEGVIFIGEEEPMEPPSAPPRPLLTSVRGDRGSRGDGLPNDFRRAT